MKQRLLEHVGKTARLKVLNELKRTQGLPVAEIASRIGMSYMGVKDICLDLEKRGLLDTWRSPQKIGRPHLHYRLTARAHDLFPTASNSATLQLLTAAQKLYGAAAPEKLLHVLFGEKTEAYLAKIKGAALPERTRALARIREEEGCMAELETDEGGAIKIVEHHSPILDLLRAYPIVAKMEADLFQRVLHTQVQREETTASGLFCATFHIGAQPG